MISSELGKEAIKKELPLIPKLPGVYRMLNSKNEILYVGKAKSLPNRLKSYISEKNHIIRTERMLSQTKKIEITFFLFLLYGFFLQYSFLTCLEDFWLFQHIIFRFLSLASYKHQEV